MILTFILNINKVFGFAIKSQIKLLYEQMDPILSVEGKGFAFIGVKT